MPIRLPRISRKTVKVTCELNTDVHAALEAYAVQYEAHHGESITIPELLAGMVGDYLRRDPDFVRERRQTAVTARPRATPASPASRSASPASRNGSPSAPASQAQGE